MNKLEALQAQTQFSGKNKALQISVKNVLSRCQSLNNTFNRNKLHSSIEQFATKVLKLL
jgi:hypothetical protein